MEMINESCSINSKEPLMEFSSIEQAKEVLKEWKKRLFLDDWTIKVELVNPHEISGFAGTTNLEFALKSALIKIIIPDEDAKNRIMKFCAEKTLVHELLHCKYNILETEHDKYESVYLGVQQHMLLEQMAKSLIMAKYNLDFDWFKNFN